MGYSASTNIIYGILVKKNQLEQKIQSCPHNITLEHAKFCPECGTPISKNSNMGVHEIVENWEKDYRIPEDIGYQFDFQFAQPNYEHSEGVIGFKLCSYDLIQEVFTPTQSMTDTILAFAEAHGLKISKQDIKMYSILNESY